MYVLHKVRSPAQHNTMNEIYEIQRMYNLCRMQNRRILSALSAYKETGEFVVESCV